MLFRNIVTLVLALCSTTATLAASPMDEFKIDPMDHFKIERSCGEMDNIANPNAAVGFADVEKIDTRRFGTWGSCYTVSFAQKKSLAGTLPQRFSVDQCFDSMPLHQLIRGIRGARDEEFESRLKVGLNLLVGIVNDDPETDDARYFRAGCAPMPLHFYIDYMSDDKRTEFIDHILHRVANPEELQP